MGRIDWTDAMLSGAGMLIVAVAAGLFLFGSGPLDIVVGGSILLVAWITYR